MGEEELKPTLFLRKATGLVRIWTWWDGFWINFSGPNIPSMLMPTLVWTWQFYGGDPLLAIIITALLCLPICGCYALLLARFPRAGGDYVIQSRILGGAVGYIINLAHSFIIWLWVPVTATCWIGISGQPMFATLAYLTGNKAYLDIAAWLISPDGLFVVSIIVWLWVTFMIAVGAYWYRKVQRIGYYIASIVMAISLISMFLTPTETFITSYNRFMEWAFGVENAYSYTITKAAELGFSLGKEINWDATIRGLVPYMMFMFTYVVWGNPMYGEITGVNEVKITWKTLWPADLYNMFLGVMIILATQHVIGWEFYMSSAYLWCIGEGLHPYYPYPQLYWSLVNPVAGLLIAIGMNFWIWPWIMNFICTSRVALAMAFDRVLPEFIGRVDSRFRTPYGALTMFAIFHSYSLTSTVIMSFGDISFLHRSVAL